MNVDLPKNVRVLNNSKRTSWKKSRPTASKLDHLFEVSSVSQSLPVPVSPMTTTLISDEALFVAVAIRSNASRVECSLNLPR